MNILKVSEIKFVWQYVSKVSNIERYRVNVTVYIKRQWDCVSVTECMER